MVKINHHSRKFLNKKKGTAHIEVTAENYEWSAGGFDATVSISDCRRSINLDFSVYNKKDLDEKIQKLDVLITELTKLQDIFIENKDAVYESIEAADKKRKENSKKRTKSEVVGIEL